MSAVEPLMEAPAPRGKAADCVAFVGDNQTHNVVDTAAQQFYPDALVRDGDSSDALAFLAETQAPRVLIVDIGDSASPLSAMLSLMTAVGDETRVIGIGSVNDISLYRELAEAGITDYLVKPVTEKALGSAFSRAQKSTREGQKAAVEKVERTVVIGTRGGAGASTVAVNLAWLMAEDRKRKTALIDLDLEFGTVALSLDLEPTRGLREALENPSRIDSLFISSATAKLSDNLSVMATEETVTGDLAFNADAVDVLFEALGRTNQCLVVDLPRPAFGIRHRVLKAATHIVLVCELSLSGLRDSIRLLGGIEDAGPNTPVTIVANHAGGGQQAMAVPEFQKALGRKVDILVPDDPKAFNKAANTGKPLVHSDPRGKAAKALRRLCERIDGTSARAKTKKPRAKLPWHRLAKKS